MAVTYSELAQDDEDRNDLNDNRSSPPLSPSPTPSSSPMPFSSMPSVESSTSMDTCSDGNSSSIVEKSRLGFSPLQNAGQTGNTATGLAVASAQATAAAAQKRNEYDLLPSSSASASPHLAALGNTSPSADVAGAESKFLQTQAQPATLNNRETGLKRFGQEPNDPDSFQSASALGHLQRVVRPTPTLRTASTKSVALAHPAPDLMTRRSSYASNIAQLEATAEKLSMTSSIEDAIRDLHEEQKRNDSRRSSLLAASISGGSDTNSASPFAFTRQISAASSILETNNAARHGGYSPAGYVMSPNNSLLSNPTRLRSGSYTRSEGGGEVETLLSRAGVGKGSIRSAKSTTKPSLTDIAEMEMPTTLTSAAMDAADRLEEHPEEEEDIYNGHMQDIDLTPNQQHPMSNANNYWNDAVFDAHKEHPEQQQEEERPRTSAESTGTFEQAERAFADFDGAHCSPSPDLEFEPLAPTFNGPSFDAPYELDLNLEMPAEPDPNRPRISRPFNATARPKSYMDPETGQQMLYYPARVPLMLNLPQKLSKKPKAAEMNKRRSQVLSMMAEPNRQSTSWLPEVVPEPLMSPLGSGLDSNLATPRLQSDPGNGHSSLEHGSENQARPNPQPSNEDARNSRMSLALSTMDLNDKRKSRMSTLGGLPPQLRASAFFEFPSEPSPNLELKDGSAMATLDSILDASAKAPVSAFVDHSFAGKLGAEVYGTEKKRRSHIKRASQANDLQVKKRSSIFHLRSHSKLSKEDRSKTITGPTREDGDNESDNESRRLAGSRDGEHKVDDDDQEEEKEEEELVYNGPPTTLLAELQIRKQQQKMRTRPLTEAFPNGLHSTLLEMDTVAEVERRNRIGKKVNLAWEEPAGDGESEDEDVPLALLMTTKGANTGIELPRPLGLMERRDQEDNEPLSRRRDRLQGCEPGPMLPLTQRHSMMTLGNALRGSRVDLLSPRREVQTPEDDEVEGETLGQRMRRLRGEEEGDNQLPRARPVSTAFSTEMFSELGDHFKKDEPEAVDDSKKKAEQPKEEEETLGQRRRRLQAEREAREREMRGDGNLNTDFTFPKLKQRHSMADVLGSHSGSRLVLTDPRAEAERAKREEAARFQRDQEMKLASLRAQLPTELTQPNVGRSGAFMNGQFNDGNAGGMGWHRASMGPGSTLGSPAIGLGHQMGIHGGGMMGTSLGMGGGGYHMSNGYGMQMQNGYGAYGTSATNGYGMPMQMQMMQSMQQPGQQYDRVNQWRQSVVPQGPL